MAAKSIKPVSINEAVLSDLASRFLLNIPKEDQDDPMKLCTHIELAYWFYLDLVRPEDTTLPGCSMKEFMAAVFSHCPFLVKDSVMVDLDNYVAQWKAHKYKKPVRGGIILNQDWTKCLLVQGYPASTTWGFPKGKLEEGEDDIDAAVRELYEETGFDSRGIIKEKWHLIAQVNGCEAKMYIIPGVPDNTYFEPKTRKEIRSIQWFRIDDLPRHKKDLTSKQALGKSANSFFMIIPFISQLRKWISSNAKSSVKASKGKTISAHFQNPAQPPPQSHSKSSTQNLQSSSKFQSPSQTHSNSGMVSPSAPPLNVITQNAHDYGASHHYGMEHGYETSEYRKPGMGYGNMKEYNSPVEIHNYPSHQEKQSSPAPQPSMAAFSRDDAAPIPFPPQHPHTLHPNHTLPAPLHHVTTGHYSPGHAAIYPSHLAYTHHHHQLQQQQHHHSNQPQLSNHQQLYPQPAVSARQDGGTTQHHHGGNSYQQGLDLNPAAVVHCVGSAPHTHNMATFSARPMGNVVNAHPHNAAYPVLPGGRSPHAHHPSTVPPTPPGQQAYYHNINRYPTAAVTVDAAALQQATPPSQYYHTHQAHYLQREQLNQLGYSPHQGQPPQKGLTPHRGLSANRERPPDEGFPPQDNPPQRHPPHQVYPPKCQSQPQLVTNDVWSPHINHHGASGSQQQKQAAATQHKSYPPMLTQQLPVTNQARDGGERIASGMAVLSLAQDGRTNSPVDLGGYNVTVKPAVSMSRFRFNREAILNTSNFRT